MSLKVWLPLLGDLRNQGSGNITITNTGATVNANGKIGNCYYFDGTDDRITIEGFSIGNQWSYGCWVLSPTSSRGWEGLIILNNTGSDADIQLGFWTYPTGNRMESQANGQYNSTISFVYGVWHHLFATFDGSSLKTYIDGALVNTKAITNGLLSRTNLTIGARRNGASSYTSYFNGYINDVRIYDTVLSAAEVREISQGLVLHYKLDGFMGGTNNNLAQGSKLLATTSAITNCNISKRGAAAIETRTNGFAQVKNTAAWQGFSLWSNSLNLKVGTTYTYSFYGYTELSTSTNAAISLYPMMYNSAGTRDTSSKLPISVMGGAFTDVNSKQIGKLTTNPQLYWATFTWNQTMADIITNGGKIELSIQVHGTFDTGRIDYLWAPKLEIGNEPTYWTPSIEEMGIDTNKIEDSSGYGHNGSVLNTPTISSDTNKYSYSLNFNGTTDGILIENLLLSNIINTEVTYSFWIKPNGENGARSIYFGSYSSTSWSIEKTAGNILRSYWNGSPDEGCSGATITDGVWQHICITKKGTNDIKAYINGEQKWTSTATHNNLTFPTTYRIGRDTRSSDGTPYKGLMSDFRIYCTALSATDIKNLYETSMYIDNCANTLPFELVEETPDIYLDKNGRLISTFYEDGAEELLQYDKTIYTEPDGSSWVHIFHHNNPAAARFSNGTADWSQGIYLDADRWYDVERILTNTCRYEFLHKQKTTSDATETKYRWVQTTNPLTATWTDVKPGTVTFVTTSGYSTSSMGGMYLMKSSNLHMCIANSTNGNWYGGIGACAVYQNGVPGYPNSAVTSGYIDLYLRIYPEAEIIKDVGFVTNEFIER